MTGNAGRLSRLRRALPVAAAAAAASVALAACGGDDEGGGAAGTDGQDPAQTATQEGEGTVRLDGESANDHGTADVSGKDSIEFELDSFYFEPTVLEGEPGQEVTLEAANESDTAHTFTLDEQGVDEVLQPGDTREVAVTFPDSGELVFVCRFHEQQGMRGALRAPDTGGDGSGSEDSGGDDPGGGGSSGGPGY